MYIYACNACIRKSAFLKIYVVVHIFIWIFRLPNWAGGLYISVYMGLVHYLKGMPFVISISQPCFCSSCGSGVLSCSYGFCFCHLAQILSLNLPKNPHNNGRLVPSAFKKCSKKYYHIVNCVCLPTRLKGADFMMLTLWEGEDERINKYWWCSKRMWLRLMVDGA